MLGWERLAQEVEEGGSGMLGRELLLGLRVKIGHFDGGVSSVEVGVGPAKGDPSGVVVGNVPAVGLIDDCSCAGGAFPVMRSG